MLMIEPYFPLPDVVKVLPRSVLFRDHRGRYHWQIVIPTHQQDPSFNGLNAVLPGEKAFAFVTKRMAREYFLGKVGDKYHSILRAARGGKALKYGAPLDGGYKVTFHPCVDGGKYTYRVVGDRILFTPPGYHPRVDWRTADRFFADHTHADRIEIGEDNEC